jgi:hypothetical protein
MRTVGEADVDSFGFAVLDGISDGFLRNLIKLADNAAFQRWDWTFSFEAARDIE